MREEKKFEVYVIERAEYQLLRDRNMYINYEVYRLYVLVLLFTLILPNILSINLLLRVKIL